MACTRLRRKPKLLSTLLGTSLEHRRKQPRRRTLRNMGAEEPTYPHSTQGRRTDSWTPPALFRGSEDGTTEFRSRKPRTWVCSPAGSRDFRSAPPRAPRTRSRSFPDGRRGAPGKEAARVTGRGRAPGGPSSLGGPGARKRPPLRKKSARAAGRPARAPQARGLPRRTFGEGYRGVLGVDGVEDALVADLRLGDEADLAADIRSAPAHGVAAVARRSHSGRSRAALAAPHARPLARSLAQSAPHRSRLTANMAAAPAPLPSPSLPPSNRGAAAAAAAAARGTLGGRGRVLSRETRRVPDRPWLSLRWLRVR